MDVVEDVTYRRELGCWLPMLVMQLFELSTALERLSVQPIKVNQNIYHTNRKTSNFCPSLSILMLS